MQERLVKREAPPVEDGAPALSDDAAAAESAASQLVAAVEAAGSAHDAQIAPSASQDEKCAAVRLNFMHSSMHTA